MAEAETHLFRRIGVEQRETWPRPDTSKKFGETDSAGGTMAYPKGPILLDPF